MSRGIEVLWSSSAKQFSTFEGESTFIFRNVGNHSPTKFSSKFSASITLY